MLEATPQLRATLEAAYQQVWAQGHAGLAPLHVLAALAADEGGVLASVAALAGVQPADLQQRLQAAVAKLPQAPAAADDDDEDVTPEFRKVMKHALKEQARAGRKLLDTKTLLRQCVAKDPAVQAVLGEVGITPKRFAALLDRVRIDDGGTESSSSAPDQALKRYTVDLTAQAEEGKLDPVIGRDEEIRRAMQILQRRTKNNPLLIGEPGVGKTAVVEGLAHRIAAKEAPAGLQHRRLLSIDIASMLAGASMRGQFEERFKQVLQAITDAPDRYIIFIDEIHMIVGAGGMPNLDVANMIKPALARGELRCLGATALAEYREHIERDAALERRFQRLLVEEPSAEAAVSILRGLADRYALHHGVRISDSAIVAAVELSQRYVSDRQLPDKAIDLMDEAAAKLRIEQDSKPEEVDRLERRLAQLKLDEAAIRTSSDAGSKERLKAQREQIKRAEEEMGELMEQWQAEKAYFTARKEGKERLSELRAELERRTQDGDWEQAAKIQNVEIPKLEAAAAAPPPKGKRLLGDEVDEREVAAVVARATGIPVSQLLEAHQAKVLGLEEHLRARVINQDEAAKAVAAAIVRAHAGLADRQRPLGCFLFLGSTGVGKTELSKELARYLFNSDRHLLRIDMSEYMESHAVARLIGAPPGYVGHEQGGQLTEAVRRRPYSVILFDEVEKAHREVLNILLQTLDDGRLTDGRGRSVDFRNTVIILTSNIGSRQLAAAPDRGAAVAAVQEEARSYFAPEFLNRLDDLIVFNALDDKANVAIARLQLKELRVRMAEEKIELEWDEQAAGLLAVRGSSPEYGARPLKRELQRAIEDPLAHRIAAGELKAGGKVKVGVKDREFEFAL